MVIDNTQEYDEIWDKVYKKLKFSPSCSYRGHSLNVPLPFQISDIFAVYGIENMTEKQCDLLDDIIRKIFIKITKEGQQIYALDWHHSAFTYDPRNDSEQINCRTNNNNDSSSFPSFFPDGDYYFFIEKNFEFGYLGHPWRQEIWIFGESLLHEIEMVHMKLGWSKIG